MQGINRMMLDTFYSDHFPQTPPHYHQYHYQPHYQNIRDKTDYFFFSFFLFIIFYRYLWVIVFVNFTTRIKCYYSYAYTINIFFRYFFNKRMMFYLPPQYFSLVFNYFLSKTSWESNAFSICFSPYPKFHYIFLAIHSFLPQKVYLFH